MEHVSSNNNVYAGIDVGGTYIKFGLADFTGSLLVINTQPTISTGDAADTVEQIVSICNILTADGAVACGIGMPGCVDANGGVQSPPNLPGWDFVPLAEVVSKAVGVPVIVDNDANMAALGELYSGSGGDESYLYLTLGTGIGGAIVIDGSLWKGPRGFAGEIGHTAINIWEESDIRREMPTYRTGTLEDFAGRAGVLRLMDTLLSRRGIQASSYPDVHDIAAAASRADPTAIQCIQTIGYAIARAIASAINLLSVTTVVVGGGIAGAGSILVSVLAEHVPIYVIPALRPLVVIRPASKGNQAGVLGAAMQAGRMYGQDAI